MKRLVLDDAARLDAARRGEDDLRPGVVDAGRQLGRGEPAEHDRVDGADPRAGQHRDDRLGDHRHVDDDAVALADAAPSSAPAKRAHALEQLGIREGALRPRDRRVVDQRRLVAAPGVDVPVEGVEAGVERGAGEPPVERRSCRRRGPGRRGDPVDVLRGLAPEPLRVLEAAPVGARIGALVGRGGGLGRRPRARHDAILVPARMREEKRPMSASRTSFLRHGARKSSVRFLISPGS